MLIKTTIQSQSYSKIQLLIYRFWQILTTSFYQVIYIKYLFQGNNPGFFIKLLHKRKLIQFEPKFFKFKEFILSAYDMMLSAVADFPRIEYKIYPELQFQDDYLKVITF